MGNCRQYNRMKCHSQCILEEPNGCCHEVMLNNISLGGALVESAEVPYSLYQGKRCSLMLSNAVFINRDCRVVWHDSMHIGVRFMESLFADQESLGSPVLS